MKLTFYIAVNQDYFKFSQILISSLVENFPNEKIKKIIINDLGLLEKQKCWIASVFDRIEFMKTSEEVIRTDFKVHTPDWREAVNQKTLGLYQSCSEENYPILMLDCDMCVVKDFSNEIFEECDLQVCRRPTIINHKGHILKYIACWFLVHTQHGKEFVESWIRAIPHIEGDQKETPALCSLIFTTGSRYSIRENKQDKIASLNAEEHDDDTRASKMLHFKSRPFQGEYVQNIEERISNVKNLPRSIREKILTYYA